MREAEEFHRGGEEKSFDISSEKPLDEPIDWTRVFTDTRVQIRSLCEKNKKKYYEETNRTFKDFYPYIYDVHNLEFTEKLYLYDRNLRKCGIFRLWIKRMENMSNFEVVAESKHKYKCEKPQLCKLKTYSIIDLKFRTLYEQRTERQVFKGFKSKRKIVWEKIPKVYRIKTFCRNDIDGEYYRNVKFLHPKNVQRVFTEAAFLFFLRCLTGMHFVGKINFNLLFINGEICPCILYISNIETINFNSNQIMIKRFLKIVKCPNGAEQRSNIILTKNGQIIYQDWSDTWLRLMLNNRAVLIDNDRPPMNPDNLVPLRERFYERRELYDFYADEYYRNLEKYRNYFNDKPDAKQIITFFVKELMLKKPHRVFDFAAKYFCELL
ncbi:hypothetical protein O3M35_012949 [Rhynocoris fuscipes]|uniref:Uncharacterized protein n=1 Tax=Rhynocoris fuscipes TaxID=488301 RepID=A0AAW1CG23_9HEMI